MDGVVVYRKRGFASLTLLLLALALGIAGYLLVGLNQTGTLPVDWPYAVGAWAGLGLLTWAVVRWRLPYADPLLLPCVFLLNGLGVAMIYRLDQASKPPMQSARLQLAWTAAAVVVLLFTVLFLRDHRRLQRYTYLWFALGLGLLLMPLLPGLGHESHGARVWIKLGAFSFQPGEIAKIVLSIAFASYLTEKRDMLATGGRRFLGLTFPRMRDLGPIAVLWGMSLLILVGETDLGMSLLFFSLFVAMVYVATQRVSWVLLGLVLVGGLGYLGYQYVGHVKVRFSSWLHPFSNYDQNYQIINAQYGFAHGGLLGQGWGLGRPNLTPIAKSDFIAAALGEELGLIGLFAVLIVYLIIVARVLRASLASREVFGKLLAAGLAFVFALQVFLIIGGVTRLLPLTGLTTPFMSQGGSSLISNYLLLGVLLTLTHQVRRPLAQIAPDEYAGLGDDATVVRKLASEGPRTPTSPSSPGGADDPTALVEVRPEAAAAAPVPPAASAVATAAPSAPSASAWATPSGSSASSTSNVSGPSAPPGSSGSSSAGDGASPWARPTGGDA